MNTSSGRRSKSARMARASSARTKVALHLALVGARELFERGLVLRVRKGEVVRVHGVRDAGDPMALDGLGDDDHRSAVRDEGARALVPGAQQRGEIVAV